ncbi:LOW QUALITY PROTEIN: hypothetical protein Cgig2_013316 [Carnegiea gigantea]|uniref:Uncharacterized protein n=1 Tax=Carnegiea gigantea TaxID=171969 RepID=A0A9Q1JEC3_9CARY|nr:LOW QUALITY PROTEIN: hypothetical protein Cgig2_013316 [Carnegiea gigantea]
MTGSPIDEGPIARLSLPPLAMGRRPRPHLAIPRSSAFFKPASFRGAQGRVLTRKRLSLYIPRENESDESGHAPYLLGLLSNKALPLLLPPMLDVSRRLFGSGVPGFEDCQPRPRLICIKQKGSQVNTKHKTTARKKSLVKNFNLGSQFNGFRLNCLSHEFRDGPRLIILTYIKLEVAGGPLLVGRSFLEGIPHGLSLIPEAEVILPVLQFWFLLNGRHEARSIVKAIPPQVVRLLGRLLNGMNKAERLSRINKAAQLTGENGDHSLGPPGTPLYTWQAAHSRWHPPQESGRNNRQARGWVPGNSDPSTTISVTTSARSFRLSTDLPDPNDALDEEGLVDALSEDELLEDCLEEQPDEPVPQEALELVEPTSASGIRHLHLGAKDAGGGGILTAGPQGSARFKKGHYTGNLFGCETKLSLLLITRRGRGGRPTLNLSPGHLGSLGPLLHQLADKAVLTLGAQSQLSRPRLRPTKSAGIICGNLWEGGEVGTKRSSNAR